MGRWVVVLEVGASIFLVRVANALIVVLFINAPYFLLINFNSFSAAV